jgi:hypothetical protein
MFSETLLLLENESKSKLSFFAFNINDDNVIMSNAEVVVYLFLV